MTDRELLRLCLEVIEAIPVAADARKMLKKLGCKPAPYAGNGSHVLCWEMAQIIRERIGA